jgi:purine nucleosidase
VTTKLILDTDIGTDVADAYALAFALRHPEFELQGVSTVAGDPVERARLVRHILVMGGQPGVPVAAGWALPLGALSPAGRRAYLARRPGHTHVGSRAQVFPRLGAAVPLILDAAGRHPGEVGVVAIGPLTNIAAALTADPELPGKLKFIAMLGADPDADRPEDNLRRDPEAAEVVFASGATMALLTRGTGRELVLLPEHLARLKASRDTLCPTLLKCTELWSAETGNGANPVLHDLTPLLWVVDPDRFQTDRTSLRVELRDRERRGGTLQEPPGESSLQLATRLREPEAARELLLGLLGAAAR